MSERRNNNKGDSYSPQPHQTNTHHPPPPPSEHKTSGSRVLCLLSWASLLVPWAVPRSHTHTQTHGTDMYTHRHAPVHPDTRTTSLRTHTFPHKHPPRVRACAHSHTHNVASHIRRLGRFAICSPGPFPLTFLGHLTSSSNSYTLLDTLRPCALTPVQ